MILKCGQVEQKLEAEIKGALDVFLQQAEPIDPLHKAWLNR